MTQAMFLSGQTEPNRIISQENVALIENLGYRKS
jgi:hypothetical protein